MELAFKSLLTTVSGVGALISLPILLHSLTVAYVEEYSSLVKHNARRAALFAGFTMLLGCLSIFLIWFVSVPLAVLTFSLFVASLVHTAQMVPDYVEDQDIPSS